MYVLDTSALQGISNDCLLRAKLQGAQLVVSPLTFFELLCHLDEGENFRKKRGTVLKCQNVEILPDPFAFHAQAFGGEELVNKTRFHDHVVVPEILKCLEESSSLDEFYKKHVTFPDGAKGTCYHAAERVRSVLDEEETKFVDHLNNMRNSMNSDGESDEKIANTGVEELSEMIAAGVSHLIGLYKNEDGFTDSNLTINVGCSIYLHLGYKSYRVVQYVKKVVKDGADFAPDPNDCEDSYILMYLPLLSGNKFVTNDSGTLEAVGMTLKAFELKTKSKADPMVEILDNDEFRARFS